MFVGHLAVALGAKRAAPNANLAWLVAGVNALDLVWPIFMVTGIERATVTPGATAFTPVVFDYYPWSHSLLMSVVWGIVLALIARAGKVQASPLLLVALVVSHWFLDVVTHAPDMQLWPGNPLKYGLTLWDSIPGTILVEGAMLVAGVATYMRTLRQSRRRPGLPFWSFVALTTLIWLSGPFSKPPETEMLGWFGMLGWIAIPWAWWADRSLRSV